MGRISALECIFLAYRHFPDVWHSFYYLKEVTFHLISILEVFKFFFFFFLTNRSLMKLFQSVHHVGQILGLLCARYIFSYKL